MPEDSAGPRFPSGNAFVVQFATSADLDAGRCVGRVEHVVSGRGGRFQSPDELLHFMAGVLRDHDGDAPAGDTSEARDEGDCR